MDKGVLKKINIMLTVEQPFVWLWVISDVLQGCGEKERLNKGQLSTVMKEYHKIFMVKKNKVF